MIAVNITPLGLTVDGHAGYAFENDVKMYGTQTWLNRLMNMKMFDSCVRKFALCSLPLYS